jgi:hypothetical protein
MADIKNPIDRKIQDMKVEMEGMIRQSNQNRQELSGQRKNMPKETPRPLAEKFKEAIHVK